MTDLSKVNLLIRELHGTDFLVEDEEGGAHVYEECAHRSADHRYDPYYFLKGSLAELLTALIKRGIEL